jgi:zinc transport system ATP-binding protein
MPETILKLENFTPHPILVVRGLNVKFEKEEVIRNLSFEVKRGEFLIVLGPNGAGKTTLFKAILGLVPSEGEIIWQGGKIPKISYLPERLSQDKFKNLAITVKEFFRFKESSDEKIFSILKAVGLEPDEILNKNPGDLSSGQFQRMLIAWSLISEPEILFFDEPATGIDIGGEETIYSLLEKFWKGKNLTVLLITHDLNIVYKYATNVLCLSKKEICCFGTPKEILTPKVLEKIYGTEIKFYEHKH